LTFQDARKGVLFIDFPPVLQLQLKRFEYDFMRDTMVKVSSRVGLNLFIFIVSICFASSILMTSLSYFYAYSPYFVCFLSTCTKLRNKKREERKSICYVAFILPFQILLLLDVHINSPL